MKFLKIEKRSRVVVSITAFLVLLAFIAIADYEIGLLFTSALSTNEVSPPPQVAIWLLGAIALTSFAYLLSIVYLITSVFYYFVEQYLYNGLFKPNHK